MHRISTDIEYLQSGKIIIDADGIPVDIPDRDYMDAAEAVLGERLAVVEGALPALEGARDEALGQVEGAVNAATEGIKWDKGAVGEGTDLNTLTPGLRAVPTIAIKNALGLPGTAAGWLETYWLLASGAIRQMDYRYKFGDSYITWSNYYVSGVWGGWTLTSTDGGSIGAGSDLNSYREPARHSVVAAGVANSPGGVVGALQVSKVGAYVFQTFTTINLDMLIRRTEGAGWTEWRQVNGDPITTDEVLQARAEAVAAIEQTGQDVLANVDSAVENAIDGVTGITDKGLWSSAGTYAPGEVVTHVGSRWIGAKTSQVTPARENLIINPRFANDRAGWSAVAGVTLAVEGASLRLTLTDDKALANALFVQAADVPVTTGTTMSAALLVHNPGASPVIVRLSINTFPTPVSSVSGDWVTIPAGDTVRATLSGTIPAGKNGARLALQAGTGGIPAGSALVVSQPIMEKSATPGTYFDGETEGANWAGDPVSSISIIPGGTTSSGPMGEPGIDTAWVLAGAVASSITPPTQGMTAPASIPEPSSTTIYVSDMSPDGLTLLSITGWHIRTSQDEGRTWQVLANFQDEGLPLPGTGRWLPDGEILVQARNSGESSRVYRSTGAATGSPTWAHVHTYTAVDQGSAHGWSWSVSGNIVLLAEYGSKTGVDNARHVYLSTDMGRSFRTIFELPNVSGLHMHGVAWDPYWDRIWVTWGDDQDAWEFSDDLGETWYTAKRDDVAIAPMQAVGIYPLEDCVLFASDGYPNGLWAIPRDQGKHTDPYDPVTLLEFNAEQRITHLCHAIYQRAPGYPVLLGWGAETVPASSKIVAARSMADVTEIWTDPHTSPAGTGIRSVVGPTARGNIIWEKQDDQQSPGRLRWVTPWPGGYRR